ncbi:MAG: hypothetical protein WBC33_05645 [Conexibacter sp.]
MAAHRQYLQLPEPVDAGLLEEVARRIYYLAEEITEFDVDCADSQIRGIDVGLDKPMSDGWARQVAATLFHDLRGLRLRPADRAWEYEPDRPAASDVDQVLCMLVDDGHARLHGRGTVSFNGIFVELFELLDSMCKIIAMDVLGARQFRFPTLLSEDVLHRGGYLDAFPHLLMSITRLKQDPIEVRRWRACHEFDRRAIGETDAAATMSTGYCLPPTMCYYVYDSLANTRVDGHRVFTACGKSFRYESRYESPFRRLWDFTIRETVFVGTQEDVRAGLRRYRQAVTGMCEGLEIAGTCESAHDPFFLRPEGALLSNAQRLVGTKLELRLRIGPSETVAAGSFNLHGAHLAERYAISLTSGKPACTACVGIGLERLMLAFLAQHGLDQARWPAVVRDALGVQRHGDIRSAVRAWAQAR